MIGGLLSTTLQVAVICSFLKNVYQAISAPITAMMVVIMVAVTIFLFPPVWWL